MIVAARSRVKTTPGRCLVTVPRRWCRDEAAHCTDRSANRGAEGSAMTTGSGSPDCSPATGADEAPQ
jgi:hypothetical protein